MNLVKVAIKNFRSIQDTTIDLNPACRVLVGINESGKSNILKALALLDPERATTLPDVRFPLEDEKPIDEAYIRYIFSLDEKDIDEIFNIVLNQVLCKNTKNMMSIKSKDQEFDLKDFCRIRAEGLYCRNVLTGTKDYRFWKLQNDKYEISSDWIKPIKAAPATLMIDVGGAIKPLTAFLMVNKNDYPDIPSEYVEQATIDDLSSAIGKAVVELVESSHPDCVYWTYDEKNILPASISLAGFSGDPSSCIPLKNMFDLAGISDIQQTIATEQTRPNGLRNLLGRVAKQTTKHIRSVWREYKSIEIMLVENGPNINASVTEGFNYFDFASRSDGFKRFVSFLIMVSVKVKTDQLTNMILLIDEPEIGLHPSGARYLRDELIKISEKNQVVYSTHSIFMIDRENIGRHLLVNKQNEVTVATEVTQSNFKDEEVIYNALGYSIFENLNEANILFEGWRDKKIFQLAIENAPKPYKKLKGEFQNVGIAHLQGVKDVGRVCPILELAKRNYVIISDSDDAAKAEQKKFSGSGRWIRWDELSNRAEIVTGEDFIKAEYIKAILTRIKVQYEKLNALNIESLDFNAAGGRLHCVNHWIGIAITKEEKRVLLDHLKGELIKSLTVNDIEEYFYEYLQHLLGQLEVGPGSK